MVSTSIASDGRWGSLPADLPDHETDAEAQAPRGGAGQRRFIGLLENVALLLLVVVLCPVAILVLGTPVALLVRLLIEVAERF